MQLSADQLQKVTHLLCYIDAHATKCISYCAPAYYADGLCDRGRAYMRMLLLNQPNAAPRQKRDNETNDEFRASILRAIDDGVYWRSRQNAPNPQDHSPNQYGGPRKNPWHPNLDGTMFYL